MTGEYGNYSTRELKKKHFIRKIPGGPLEWDSSCQPTQESQHFMQFHQQ